MQGRQTIQESDVQQGPRVRVYEIAKEVGLPNKALLAKVRGLGIDVKNHMSAIDLDDVQRVKRALEKERVENREVKRISATVIRRRAKTVAKAAPAATEEGESAAAEGDTAAESAEAGALAVESPTAPSDLQTEPAVAAPEGADSAETPRDSGEPSSVEVATTGDEGGPDTAAAEATPTPTHRPKREIRFAPGFGPTAKPAARPAGEEQPISAAEAARMMGPAMARRPQVVITDLDTRRDLGRKDLFVDKRRGLRGRKKKVTTGKKGKKTEITMPAEHKRVLRLADAITVGDIARQMGVKATEVLKKLWAEGMTNVTINQAIDTDTASLIASEFGYEVEDVAFREEQVLQVVADSPEDLVPRAPVVTVMGHVDHGKTSLLDTIRGAEVASGEAGGITQHMGAYRVGTPKGELVFLDTPGHEAFTQMRARGAHCTDVVVLVVAADDGVMPQTVEAIDHAREAKVPLVVAVNKIDRPDANPDRVRTQLAERNLVPEDWGGDTLYVNVSAVSKEGVDALLESLLLQSELLELTANSDKPAVGVVIEARMDRARGSMCTVLVREGTLRVGDIVVTGEHVGKVRALLDDRGQSISEAGPSSPVEVLGLGGVPQAGDALNALADEKAARQLAEHRRNLSRRKELGTATSRATYEDIVGQIQTGTAQELKILIKADVQGSAEAVKDAVTKLSNEKVTVNVISAAAGGIHETDVNLAKAAGSLIVGFSVRPAGKASQLAEREGVEVRIYDVIYELLDDVKDLMRGLLPKVRAEKAIGRVEVRTTFTIPKVGVIAGCAVVDGKVVRGAHLRVIREDVKVYDGKVGSLKRFKDDVKEVAQGYECGLSVDGYNEVREGDVLEVYEVEELAPELA